MPITKAPYKVCFHMSYTPDGVEGKRYHGKMHYTGFTLEDAVAKVIGNIAWGYLHGRSTCTSMWLMRKPEGETRSNIKWTEYNSKPENAQKFREAVSKTHKATVELYAE